MTDLSDDEAFAAEYALGTLDAAEHAAAESRRAHDATFDCLVCAWEARLEPLIATTTEILPPAGVLADLLARLPANGRTDAGDNVLVLHRRLRVWRGVASVASALAAMLALWIVRTGLQPAQQNQTFMAVLQHDAGAPAVVVSLDLGHHRMTVTPLAVAAPPGKSYQLWMIAGDQTPPRSMGLIESQATVRPELPETAAGEMAKVTYAVTLEPAGGSPTGLPTSTPVLVGKPVQASL